VNNLTPEKEFEDEQMVEKKKRDIEKTERRKEFQDAIQNGREDNSYTDKQRLARMEKNFNRAEGIVADLADEGLTLAQRVVELGRAVSKEEKRVHIAGDKIDKIEGILKNYKKEEDKYEEQVDKKENIKREDYARYGFYILAAVSIIVSIVALYFNSKGGN
jgi:hypothetical protein